MFNNNQPMLSAGAAPKAAREGSPGPRPASLPEGKGRRAAMHGYAGRAQPLGLRWRSRRGGRPSVARATVFFTAAPSPTTAPSSGAGSTSPGLAGGACTPCLAVRGSRGAVAPRLVSVTPVSGGAATLAAAASPRLEGEEAGTDGAH